jgi:hypothetical protein
MKAEAKDEMDVLKLQKVAACQLKSYCLGMNELMELSQKSTGILTSHQREILARMRNTIGIACGHGEPYKIWSNLVS